MKTEWVTNTAGSCPISAEGFTSASASLDTYYGKLSSSWKVEGEKLTLDIEVPVNTTATVFVPSDELSKVSEGGKPLPDVKDIQVVEAKDGWVVLKVDRGGTGSQDKNLFEHRTPNKE